ncbi:MAG: hypothetical protein GX995_07270 [Clostridiales bacterium]|nr:hypothetical protein [Clostridiales bacterium]
MGYNMQIMTKDKGNDKLEGFLYKEGIDAYYTQSESWCTIKSYNGYNVEYETTVYIYNKVPPVETMKELENGLIISANMAK